MCLCRLHNFCINVKDEDALQTSHKDATYDVQFMDALHNRADDCITSNATLHHLGRGIPSGLLHGGNHFHDASRNQSVPANPCPMDDMMAHIKCLNLVRPMSTR